MYGLREIKIEYTWLLHIILAGVLGIITSNDDIYRIDYL